jgi:hypothetical protein
MAMERVRRSRELQDMTIGKEYKFLTAKAGLLLSTALMSESNLFIVQNNERFKIHQAIVRK